ncbi:MAG: hypothetical protein E7672_07920 [Ruminococcaceae bacterium]|nr:hypothetical protein [Oscillospiraceae bacterium]
MTQPNFKGGIALQVAFDPLSMSAFEKELENGEFNEECLYSFVDQYTGTQVKALMFSVFAQASETPSKVFSDFESLYNREIENGTRVNYKKIYYHIHKCLTEYGIDVHDVLFRRCHEKGIEPWLSVRMNDCNGPRENTLSIRSDFFYEAKKKGWLIGILPRHGLHYHYAYNYAVPEVRQQMTAYIQEQLGRYDVDGIELDFTREIICFRYMECPNKCELMTEFIRKIKWLTYMVTMKFGHKVSLAVRLYRDIDQCKEFGLDVETWDREGLVDMITVSSRYLSCDNDMPISEWKRRLPNTKIAASVEAYFAPPHNKTDVSYPPKYHSRITTDIANGMAAAFVSEGADMIYLSAYCLGYKPNKQSPRYKRSIEMINRMGDSETIFANRRRHVIMFQEYETVPVGFESYHPLPVGISRGDTEEISLPIGHVPEGKMAQLVVGFDYGEPSDVEIYVNNKPCRDFKICNEEILKKFESFDPGIPMHAPSSTLYIADIEAESLMRYTINITAKDDVVIDYIEVNID